MKDGSGELARTAAAWEATAKAVEVVLKTWQEIVAPKDKPEPAAADQAFLREDALHHVAPHAREAAALRPADHARPGPLRCITGDRLPPGFDLLDFTDLLAVSSTLQ